MFFFFVLIAMVSAGRSLAMRKYSLAAFCFLFLLTSCTFSDENSESNSEMESSESESLAKDQASDSLTYEVGEVYENITFDQPLYFTSAYDDSNKVFIVERTGKIYVMDNQPNVTTKEVFVDLSNKISTNGNEMGLLGLAFHPDFKQNGYYYVNYTTQEETVISRFKADLKSYETDLNSETIFMTFPQPYTNHNGGHLAFGLDGYLYIGTGDGGGSGDPQNNAQDLTEIHGKLLRIDVDKKTDESEYSIPEDNPYEGNSENYREEIFAYGFRNPWKFSFDTQKEELWLADVGQNVLEEINLVESGKNYGWRLKEGTKEYIPDNSTNNQTLEDPIWVYDHSQGQSITGGYIYNGSENPSLKGAYIYGDFISGRVWALKKSEDGQIKNKELLDTDLMISSFGLDENGELVIVDFNGKLYKLIEKR